MKNPPEPETMRCGHVHRSGPILPNVVFGGGISMGQCQHLVVPGLVFCLDHANKEALGLMVQQLSREVQDLRASNAKLRRAIKKMRGERA